MNVYGPIAVGVLSAPCGLVVDKPLPCLQRAGLFRCLSGAGLVC